MSLMLLGILNSQAAGGGGVLAYDHIQTSTANGTTGITFSGLGSLTDYKHLQIRMVTKLNFNIGDDAFNIKLTFNGVSGTGNYSWHRLYTFGEVRSQASVSAEDISFYDITPSSTLPNQYGAGVIDILDFASTNKRTTTRTFYGNVGQGNNVSLHSGLFNSTNAVTSLSLESTAFTLLNSRFSLYGVK
jgi:hypothetical protein